MRILLRRRDGKLQHYNISRMRLKSYSSSKQGRRRIYELSPVMSEAERRGFDKVSGGMPYRDVKDYKNYRVREWMGKTRKRLGRFKGYYRFWKGNRYKDVEGISHMRNPQHELVQMRYESYANALSKLGFSPDDSRLLSWTILTYEKRKRKRA